MTQGIKRWWRTRWRAVRPDGGSVLVEFIVLGVLMSLPICYLVITLARVQAGAYAVTAASREGGRAFVTAPAADRASARARAAAGLAFADQGFTGAGEIRIDCDHTPCLTPESRVHVTASVQVPLPLVPDFLGGVVPTSVSVSADHTSVVDRFRSVP